MRIVEKFSDALRKLSRCVAKHRLKKYRVFKVSGDLNFFKKNKQRLHLILHLGHFLLLLRTIHFLTAAAASNPRLVFALLTAGANHDARVQRRSPLCPSPRSPKPPAAPTPSPPSSTPAHLTALLLPAAAVSNPHLVSALFVTGANRDAHARRQSPLRPRLRSPTPPVVPTPSPPSSSPPPLPATFALFLPSSPPVQTMTPAAPPSLSSQHLWQHRRHCRPPRCWHPSRPYRPQSPLPCRRRSISLLAGSCPDPAWVGAPPPDGQMPVHAAAVPGNLDVSPLVAVIPTRLTFMGGSLSTMPLPIVYLRCSSAHTDILM